MELKMKVVYSIEETRYYEKGGVDIKSNISDDKLVVCQISKSLVDHLKKESVVLEPDKLLLGFAEAQKRGIQDTLGDLDNIELNIKNHSDAIDLKLYEADTERGRKYEELEKRFSETSAKIDSKLSGTGESLQDNIDKIDAIYEKLNKVNGYSLENLMSTLTKILQLVEKDKDLVKMVLDRKK